MKTVIFVAMAFCLSFNTISSAIASNSREDEKQFTGTFVGLSDDYEFMFKDENGKVIIFRETGEEVDIDLYDDEIIGKKFVVTWIEIVDDLYDDEGEPTGETETFNQIVSLVQQD